MSTFLTVGMTHHDAPLPALEQVATGASAQVDLRAMALASGCAEILLLSTCSRVELHAVVDYPGRLDPSSAQDEARAYADHVAELLGKTMVGHLGEPVGPVTTSVGADAVRHLFRVAAGLGSRIFGEVEVQTQLRTAIRRAQAAQGEPHRLRHLVAAAVASARNTARDHPHLCRRGLLAERAAAVAPAAGAQGAPAEVVVVGAGAMGRQVVAALRDRGCRVALLSRTSSARSSRGPRVLPLEELATRLPTADAVFVATSAGRRLLSSAAVAGAVAGREERALTIVDLALPRNVDPLVGGVRGVRLLNLDDLSDAACRLVPDRPAPDRPAPDRLGVAEVESAIVAAADAYCARIRSRRVGPLVSALQEQLQSLCMEQLRRTTRGHQLPDEVLTRMASAVAGAVGHGPTVLAREAAGNEDETTLAVLAAAFRLQDVTAAG
jgi:glutamyl-tRNA reductase